MSLIKRLFKEKLNSSESFEQQKNEQPEKETQLKNANIQVEENIEKTTISIIDEIKTYIKSNTALFKVLNEGESNIGFVYVINPEIVIYVSSHSVSNEIAIITFGGNIPEDRIVEFIVKNKNYWISENGGSWFYHSKMTNFCEDSDFDMEKLRDEIVFHIRYAEQTNPKINNWINNNAELEL